MGYSREDILRARRGGFSHGFVTRVWCFLAFSVILCIRFLHKTCG